MRYVIWTFVLLLVAGALFVAAGWRPPYRYNPWAPLDLRADPDWLTRFRLFRLQDNARQCLSALARSGAQFRVVPDKRSSDGCGWENAVMLSGTGIARLEKPALVTCPLASSLVLFDLHDLQPSAQAAFGESVAVIHHVGSYNCRNVKGDDSSALSSHAQARAIDVTGFRLADGRDIMVSGDSRHAADGAFLRSTQQHACGFFGMVLGPGYNAAHATHFHMQAGSAGWCP